MNHEVYLRLSANDKALATQSLNIVRKSFPVNEQMSDAFWSETLSKLDLESNFQWYVIAINDTVVGMFFLDVVSVTNANPGAFLWYVCVAEEHRGDGIGTRVYSEIRRIAANSGCQDIMFEIDIPDHQGIPDSDEFRLAERRMRWYQRMGAQLLAGVEWYQEVDNGSDPTKMWLMYDSLGHVTSPEAAFDRVCLISGKQLERSEVISLA